LKILKDIGFGVVVALLIYQVMENWVLVSSILRIPKKAVTGPEALFGQQADVLGQFARADPEAEAFGMVRVGGELWRARMTDNTELAPQVGDRVRIISREGLELRVARADKPEVT
jgi:membrane protein implicated in regulation of membrane protease activity